jgi:hypothetical protein
MDAFIESLLWRKTDTISSKCIEYINQYILPDPYYNEVFLETIISISTIKDHYFNAYFLHKHLIKYTLADRDATWTCFLRYRFSEETSIKRLVDWGWGEDDKSHIQDESIKLAAITLSWFLTSTDRELRDSSTKALICLLKNRIHILIDILKVFECVNDPYVYERLFAVAYGCALQSSDKENIWQLCNYVYVTIFKNKEEIYPHILLRDYARNIIEYTAFLGTELAFDINDVRPPYKSKFKLKEITERDIERKYDLKIKTGVSAQHRIISSMGTELGIYARPYGDFGRYVFQSKFYDWNIDPSIFSNMAIDLIFEKYGYSEIKHGHYDNSLP